MHGEIISCHNHSGKGHPQIEGIGFLFLDGFLTQAGTAFHLPEETNLPFPSCLFPSLLFLQLGEWCPSLIYAKTDLTYSPANSHLLLHCRVTTLVKIVQITKLISMFSSPSHTDHQPAPKTTVCNPHFKGKQNSVKFTLRWTTCHVCTTAGQKLNSISYFYAARAEQSLEHTSSCLLQS